MKSSRRSGRHREQQERTHIHTIPPYCLSLIEMYIRPVLGSLGIVTSSPSSSSSPCAPTIPQHSCQTPFCCLSFRHTSSFPPRFTHNPFSTHFSPRMNTIFPRLPQSIGQSWLCSGITTWSSSVLSSSSSSPSTWPSPPLAPPPSVSPGSGITSSHKSPFRVQGSPPPDPCRPPSSRINPS